MNERDVLQAIDQLRRDLNGYHGQLKAHDDLQRHCDNQRKRISELEGLYAKVKNENIKLRKLSLDMFLYLYDGFIISDEMANEFAEKLRELEIEIE